MNEMKLKQDGWAVRYDGTRDSALCVARKVYPGDSDDTLDRTFDRYAGCMRIRVPTGYVIQVQDNHWLAFWGDRFLGMEQISQEMIHVQEPDDGMSPFTRAIMRDWSGYGP